MSQLLSVNTSEGLLRAAAAYKGCPQTESSPLASQGHDLALKRNDSQCASFWCSEVLSAEAKWKEGSVYHMVRFSHVSEEHRRCFKNISRMVVEHHSWPMCSTDFICATDDTKFLMSASDCMPTECRVGEEVVLLFMLFTTAVIILLSATIMGVIIACPEFHKPKYYLRFSLAFTDFLIGVLVCGHAAYNQYVSLSEVPGDRFQGYANLEDGQLFRHVPNCLYGVSDTATQISGFVASAAVIASLYQLAFMSLDRHLLLTKTNYRSLVTGKRVLLSLSIAWGFGLTVPALHFYYKPVRIKAICINYDTSPYDVHIINNESKIASVNYALYLLQAVPLTVTVVVVVIPVTAMLTFSLRTMRKYAAYSQEHSVKQVKLALLLTHATYSDPNLLAAAAAGAGSGYGGRPATGGRWWRRGRQEPRAPPVSRVPSNTVIHSASTDGLGLSTKENRAQKPASSSWRRCCCCCASGPATAPGTPSSSPELDAGRPSTRASSTRSARLNKRMSSVERDREITQAVLINVVVFMLACFPMLFVGGWMLYLFFTHQVSLNNRAPLKQLLFVAPWLLALNSVWNSALHFAYNRNFRRATCRMFCKLWPTKKCFKSAK